jgi:hypothetical protein
MEMRVISGIAECLIVWSIIIGVPVGLYYAVTYDIPRERTVVAAAVVTQEQLDRLEQHKRDFAACKQVERELRWGTVRLKCE